jgi:hypothetical protein
VVFTNVRYKPDGSDGGVFYKKAPVLAAFVEGSPLGAFPPELTPHEGDRVFMRDAVPPHASVEFDVDHDLRARRAIESARELEVTDSRDHPMPEDRLRFLRQARSEDADRRIDAIRAKPRAFAAVRDGEFMRASLDRGSRHHRSAVSVRVGLDHRHDAASRADARTNAREVASHGVEIDVRPNARRQRRARFIVSYPQHPPRAP